MGFYVAGPLLFNLPGTKMEPLCALGISGIWGLYGAIYFLRSSKSKLEKPCCSNRKARSASSAYRIRGTLCRRLGGSFH